MRRSTLSIWILSGVALLAAALGCGSGDAPTASISEDEGSGSGSTASQQSDADREREARRQADLFPIVEFTTTAGTFKLKLDRAKAEQTVDNFLNYVGSGFYQGTVFHQVDKGFVVAAGGYTEQMQPKPTRVAIRNEAYNGLKNARATVAMVRSPGAVDSATSQFLINLADNLFLDYKSREISEDGSDQYGYCVFGEVVEGWDVIEAIANVPAQTTTVKIARPRPAAAKKVAAQPVGQNGGVEAAADSSVGGTAVAAASPTAPPAVEPPVVEPPVYDDVVFEALPTRPIVIQSARRVK
ncbi:MAG: peptidylprolyl isomerase [Pirellulales bacterium]